jgi:hypothetical protein
MQDELRAAAPDLNIEIVGINQITSAAYNSLIANRTLAWLQDTTNATAQLHWQAVYRDVRILDWKNEVQAVYNLTEHDLAIETNRAALKAIFLAAAKSADSDGDGLPDSWELHYFGNLSSGPDDDPDLDGVNNRTEFAFGTNPTDPKSFQPIRVVPQQTTPGPIVFAFRRPAGSILSYVIETAPKLGGGWVVDANLLNIQQPRNLYDGTGTAEVTCWPTDAARKEPIQFMRVGPVARP